MKHPTMQQSENFIFWKKRNLLDPLEIVNLADSNRKSSYEITFPLIMDP